MWLALVMAARSGGRAANLAASGGVKGCAGIGDLLQLSTAGDRHTGRDSGSTNPSLLGEECQQNLVRFEVRALARNALPLLK
jgi:hypothetical protein